MHKSIKDWAEPDLQKHNQLDMLFHSYLIDQNEEHAPFIFFI